VRPMRSTPPKSALRTVARSHPAERQQHRQAHPAVTRDRVAPPTRLRLRRVRPPSSSREGGSDEFDKLRDSRCSDRTCQPVRQLLVRLEEVSDP
jgi:hypothetical protein